MALWTVCTLLLSDIDPTLVLFDRSVQYGIHVGSHDVESLRKRVIIL